MNHGHIRIGVPNHLVPPPVPQPPWSQCCGAEVWDWEFAALGIQREAWAEASNVVGKFCNLPPHRDGPHAAVDRTTGVAVVWGGE